MASDCLQHVRYVRLKQTAQKWLSNGSFVLIVWIACDSCSCFAPSVYHTNTVVCHFEGGRHTQWLFHTPQQGMGQGEGQGAKKGMGHLCCQAPPLQSELP